VATHGVVRHLLRACGLARGTRTEQGATAAGATRFPPSPRATERSSALHGPGCQRDIHARLDVDVCGERVRRRESRAGHAMNGALPIAMAIVVSIGACGGRTTDATDQDGGDAAVRECRPIPNPFPVERVLCNKGDDQRCQAWAQSLTVSGYAHATCYQHGCCMGTAETDPLNGNQLCGCGNGRECISNEVCVSDVPGGPPTCRPVCLPDCLFSMKDGCNKPDEACFCSGVRDRCAPDKVCVLYPPGGGPPGSCVSQCVSTSDSGLDGG
jgi:hypothetical protein